MRILIVFATTEGHTSKLVRFVAARLVGAGHQVQACDVGQSDPPNPAEFEAVLLAGSIHIGRYQERLISFARSHHAALNAMPTAFLSVSLSAAGDNPGDWAGLRNCVRRLEQETAWRPGAVHHAAGAMPFSAYGLLTKLVMRWIASRRRMRVTTSQDYDFTNYDVLGSFIDEFVMSFAKGRRETVANAGCAGDLC